MASIPGVDFSFIQMEDMEEERKQMGWHAEGSSYVIRYSGAGAECRRLMRESDITVFGGVDESLAYERQDLGKPTFRYSERLYKEGQWKFISPRGLVKKYRDHTRYKNAPVYLLCAGGYVASDFSLIHAYPDKKYVWGYFPEIISYGKESLHENRGTDEVLKLLWCGRMIDWKHAEDALFISRKLWDDGIEHELTLVGGGVLEEKLKEKAAALGIADSTHFEGFKSPEETRKYMRRADIYLFTSDRKEGWGAVLNEAMNSGCAVVADHAIGAVPFMLRHGYNGMVYKDGDVSEATAYVKKLSTDALLRKELGMHAYETVSKYWNAGYAGDKLYELFVSVLGGESFCNKERSDIPLPVQKADVIAPSKGYDYVRGDHSR